MHFSVLEIVLAALAVAVVAYLLGQAAARRSGRSRTGQGPGADVKDFRFGPPACARRSAEADEVAAAPAAGGGSDWRVVRTQRTVTTQGPVDLSALGLGALLGRAIASGDGGPRRIVVEQEAGPLVVEGGPLGEEERRQVVEKVRAALGGEVATAVEEALASQGKPSRK